MIRTWTQYAERIERHYANEHSKEGDNEDSSCDVCYPPDISIADPTYLNFLNWFKNTYKIRYHTSRTITYYSLARKYPLELQKWIIYVITSIRYKEEQNFQEMLEEVVNQWEETEGFRTRIRQEPSESSTGNRNKGKGVEQSTSRIRPETSGEGSNRRRDNVEDYEYDPQDRLNINLSRSDRGYEDIFEEEVEEYDNDQLYDNRRNNNNRIPRD